MARGVSLSSLLDSLRAELSEVTQVNLTIQTKPILVRALQRAQSALVVAPGFTWSHMRVRETKNVSAGQRYCDIPTSLDYDRIDKVQALWNTIWSRPLTRGISMDQYNIYNSDNDVRSDPIQRWDIVSISGATQVECWPMPASNTDDGLLFTGRRALKPLLVDSDVCDLDSEILLLYAAGTYLETVDPARANAKKSQAKALFNQTVGRAGKTTNRYSFADTPQDQQQPQNTRFIVVSRST